MDKKVDIVDIDLSKLKSEADKAAGSLNELNDTLEETSQAATDINSSADNAAAGFKKIGDSAEQAESKTDLILSAFEHTTRISAGLVGSIEVVEGAFQAMGVESEEVTQVLAKMQGVMAVTDGLLAIAEGIKSFKELKKVVQSLGIVQNVTNAATVAGTAATVAGTTATVADTAATVAGTTAKSAFAVACGVAGKAVKKLTIALIKNPITLIAVAITSAIGALVEWAHSAEEAADSEENLSRAVDDLTSDITRQNDALERLIKLLRARGVEEEYILKMRLSHARDQYKQYDDEMKRLEKLGKASSEAYKKAREGRKNAGKAIDDLKTDIEIENIKKVKKDEEEKTRIVKEAARKRIEAAKAEAEEMARIRKEAQDRYKLDMEDLEEELKKDKMSANELELYEAAKHYHDLFQEYKTEYYDKKLISEELWSNMVIAINKKVETVQMGIFKKREEQIKERIEEAHSAIHEISQISDQQKDLQYESRIEQWTQAMGAGATILDLYNNKISAASEIAAKRILDTREMIEKLVERYEKKSLSDIIEKSIGLQRFAPGYVLQLSNMAVDLEKDFDAWANKLGITVQKVVKDRILNAQYGRTIILQAIIPKIIELLDAATERMNNAAGKDDENNKKVYDIQKNRVEILKKELDDYNQWVNVLLQAEGYFYKHITESEEDKLVEIHTKIDLVQDSLSRTKNTFSELTSIGLDGTQQLNAAWGNLIDKMQEGTEKVRLGLTTVARGFENNKEKADKGGQAFYKYGQMASASLGVMSGLMQALGSEQDESTEKGFKKKKKFEIAAATMSMLSGILDAWTGAMELGPILGPIFGSINSAMIAAMGAVQIRKIKRTKMDGNSSEETGIGSTAQPSASALQMLGQGPLATTDIIGAKHQGEVKDQRVYVLESDISHTQDSIKTAVKEATF